MGMSTTVLGFRPADERYKSMLAVHIACEAAGVRPPEEVLNFFDHESPDPDGPGIEVALPKEAVRPYQTDYRSGYDVDVTRLPPDVKIVRFYNSW